MSTLITVLIVVIVAIVVVAIVVKSKKKKGGELMAQQPVNEPQAPASQPTPEEASSNMSDSDTEPQV